MSGGRRALSTASLVLVAACSREGSHTEKPAVVTSAAASVAESATTVAAPAGAKLDCIGEPTAERFVVYLHGMDSEAPSEQEQHNREVLAKLAKAQGVRFALPRASMACPTRAGSVCWGWKFDEAEASAAATQIDAAATGCFPGKPYGVLGFSNGGYLLNKLLRSCRLEAMLPKAEWLIGVGSARFEGEGELEAEPKSLAGCGRLLLLSGREDSYNFDPKHHLYELLVAKGADVEHFEFPGGHILEETSLKQALERVSKAR